MISLLYPAATRRPVFVFLSKCQSDCSNRKLSFSVCVCSLSFCRTSWADSEQRITLREPGVCIYSSVQGRFHHWGCWGCIPLHQQCLLIWSNNIYGPPRSTAKHVVSPLQYSDMAMIMLVNAKSSRTRRHNLNVRIDYNGQ